MTRKEPILLSQRFRVPALIFAILALNSLDGGFREEPASMQAFPAVRIEDHGTFILTLAGRKIGTERFEIRASQRNIEADGEIDLRVEQGGRTLNFRSFPKLVMDDRLQPLTYAWNQEAPQASRLEVDFRVSPAITHYHTVSGADDRRDFALPKEVVVLDDNVIHHYQLVVDRYRIGPGKKQNFKAFIPQEALAGFLSVEEKGAEPVDTQGNTETLDHLVASTDLAQIDLWVDGQQRLQRVFIPATQFVAVRERPLAKDERPPPPGTPRSFRLAYSRLNLPY